MLQISEFKPRVCTSLCRMTRRNVHKIYFAEYAINLLPILVYWNRGTEQQKSETTTNTKCMNHYTSGWSWSTNDLRTIFYLIKTVIVRTLVVNILCWKVCWAVVVYQGVIYRSKCGRECLCLYASLWSMRMSVIIININWESLSVRFQSWGKYAIVVLFHHAKIYFSCLDSCQSGVAEISL